MIRLKASKSLIALKSKSKKSKRLKIRDNFWGKTRRRSKKMKVAKRSRKLTMIKMFWGGMVKTKKIKKRARKNKAIGLTNLTTALLLLRVKRAIL